MAGMIMTTRIPMVMITIAGMTTITGIVMVMVMTMIMDKDRTTSRRC